MSGYSCPNPACDYVFPSGSVTGAAALKCPVCGNVFHLQKSAVAPRPTAPQPVAPPPGPAPPGPSDASAILFATPAHVTPLAVRRSTPKPRGRVARFVVLALFVALSGWLLISTYAYLRKHGRTPEPTGGVLDFEKSNFRFRVPVSGWERDDGPRAPLKSVFAMRRADPVSWLAIASRDYKHATPKDGELLQEAEQRLHAYFAHLEWEQKADERLAGQRAVRLVFTGERDETPMVGECYALGTRGFGYWFFTWTPAGDAQTAAAQEWAELRQGFSLGRERENWQEKIPKLVAIAGKNANYSLRYAESLWEARTPREYDADADVALFGQDRSESPVAGKSATALALLLPPQGDLAGALDGAKKHLQSRQPMNARLEVLAEKTADAERVGHFSGRIVKLRVEVPDNSYQRFVELAVVQLAEQTLAVQCECAWDHRSYWEADFDRLINTLEVNR